MNKQRANLKRTRKKAGHSQWRATSASIDWVHHAIESPYNQQLSLRMNPKPAHTHRHTYTQLCSLFCFFWESTNNKPNWQVVGTHKSSSVAGLSTCTLAGLKPRHLFWGPPRSQTGALPLTHHHPWGLGHNRVWKACSNLDILSLMKLDNNNNSLIHSFIHMMLQFQQTF